MKRNLLIGTSLAVASFATPEARYVATTDAAFRARTLSADAYVIAVKAFESETTEGRVALKAGETPTTLLNRALSEEAGRQALAGILNAKDDEKSLRAALDDLSSKKGSKEAALAALARALSINPELRKFVEEFRPAFLAQGSVAKKKGDTGSDVQGPVQPVRPDIGKNVPVIVEQPNYVTLSKDVLSAEQALVQAMRDEYSATTAAEEAAEAVKRAQAAKDSASSSLQTATKVAEDAVTKATEAKTALTAAEEALNALNTKHKELEKLVNEAETKAAGKVVSSAEVLAFNKLNAEIKVLNADIAIKTAAVTAARAKDAEAETASKEAADKAAAAKTAYELAAEAFTAAEKASKEAADKDAAAKTAQAEANTKLAAAVKAALEAATKEAEKASKDAVATKAAADAAEVKKTELQTAAQTAKDRVIELGKRKTGLHSELTAARAVDTANSTAETQAAVKVKEAAVIEIATELAKAEINAKHAEQAAKDAVKVAAKTAHDAENAAEAKKAADSNLSAANEKAKNNTVIEAVKEEIVKQEESRLAAEKAAAAAAEKASKEAADKAAAEKHAEAEKVSKDAAVVAAAEKAAAEKAAEIADAVTKALAEAKKTADTEREAALAEAKKAAEAETAAAVAAAAADAAKDAAVAAHLALQANAGNVAFQTAAAAADAAKDAAVAEAAKLAAAADAAKQAAAAAAAKQADAESAVVAANAKRVEAEKVAAAAEQRAADAADAAHKARQEAADAKQAADKRAADAVAAKEAAEQATAAAEQKLIDAKKAAEQATAAAKQAADEAVARSAKTVQDLRIELSRERENNDDLVAQYHKARDEISNLQAQLEKLTNEAKALTDEAKVYNPDKAFAALISKYEADLRAAQSAKDDAAGTIKTLSSQIIVDNVRLDDDRYTLAEVRALADENNHPELVNAIDAYSQYSFEFDTTNRVLASANELNVLSEVEGVEGKPSDAVARMINRLIAHKKTEALDRLLRGEESQIDVIAKVAEGFEELKGIVDIYNSVIKDLIDEDVSGTEEPLVVTDDSETENDEGARTEASVNGVNVSGTEVEAPRETEAEAPRVAEPAEELHVVRAKEVRNSFIGQLQTIVEGFDVDTKTFNALVSATIGHFKGMIDDDLRSDKNIDGMFQHLGDLQYSLSEATKGRYESVYELLRTIRAVDKNIQEWKNANDEMNATRIEYPHLITLDQDKLNAYNIKIGALYDNKKALEQQLKNIIASYEDASRKEAHGSRIQNLTDDTLGALKLALTQYNDYLNSIKSRKDMYMLPEADKAMYERIIAAYGLTSSNFRDNLITLNEKGAEFKSSLEQKRADAQSNYDKMKTLEGDSEVIGVIKKLQDLKATLHGQRIKVSFFNENELLKIVKDDTLSEGEKAAANLELGNLNTFKNEIKGLEAEIAQLEAENAKLKELLDLETKHVALDLEIKDDSETLEKLRGDYDWLDRAYGYVKKERKKMILGAPELVTGITTAITTIMSPVPAAFEQEDEYESQEDGSGDDTDDLGAPSTGQKVSGAFGGQFGGQKSESATVGFSADNTQTPPPPPARSQSGQNQLVDDASAGNAGNSTTAAQSVDGEGQNQLVDDASAGNAGNSAPAAQSVDGQGQDQSVDGASSGDSGNLNPVHQSVDGQGQDPVAVAQLAPPPPPAQSVDGASSGNAGNSTPPAPPAAVNSGSTTPDSQQSDKSTFTAADIDRAAAEQTAALFGA